MNSKRCGAASGLAQSEGRRRERWPKRHHRNTIHIKSVAPRNPAPQLPSQPPHGFDFEHEPPSALITPYFIPKRRRHRHAAAGQESRQQIAFFLPLVEAWEGGAHGYLLPFVSSVYLELVVEDTHFLIWVFG